MKKDIIELNMNIESENFIFNENKRFRIPLYQRAYAWGKDEIEALINDIVDFNRKGENKKYYLGFLVVHDAKKYLEVIDGQQRLTTLFILLKVLGYEFNSSSLTFECRDISNKTLDNIDDLELLEKAEKNIVDAKRIIEDAFLHDETKKNEFKEKLKNVVLYQIEVPPNTDLNHYFEIMNTRGEQLEQADILKAKLISKLNDEKERNVFSTIWSACSDMSGYVLRHFKKNIEKKLFEKNPSSLNRDYLLFELFNELPSQENTYDIKDIIQKEEFEEITNIYINEQNNENTTFQSIIPKFSYFLEHVLKVYIRANNVQRINKKDFYEQLDDKKLTEYFDIVINEGCIDDNKINVIKFSQDFITLLLKIRILFDKYVIKRSFKKDDSDGEWSLQSPAFDTKNGFYTKDTSFLKSRQRERTNKFRHKDNLMIQACCRVSYTSPQTMHWITEVLLYLHKKESVYLTRNVDEEEKNNYIYLNEVVENFVKEKGIRPYIEVEENITERSSYQSGFATPHIVLNYIDYLLRQRDKEHNFVFTNRNSLEHWYPRHPAQGSIETYDKVDRLGNLCLLTSDINSKFSNASPEEKSRYVKNILYPSLKLLEMKKLTEDTSDNKSWKDDKVEKHEIEIIELLKNSIKYY